MGTASTSATFSATPGHTYYFRSRARDKAYNVERWPSGDGDAYTTLYTWAVTGTVRDNREIPVAGVNITTVPAAFNVKPSDDNGLYVAYVADSASTYTVTWGKNGYGNLPSTSFSGAQDAQFDVVLPPADNVVCNWGFESGGFEPGDWQASGMITPVVTSTLKHSGHYAALLGWLESAFAPVLNLSNTSGDSWYPQLAVDGNGTLHVVWGDDTPGSSGIYYVRRDSDGTWSSPRNISNNSGYSNIPQLAVDGNGVLHVAWLDDTPGNYDIYYAWRDSDGTWSSPQNISNSFGNPFYLQLAVDGSGALYVVWSESPPGYLDIYYAWRDSDGTWSSPRNISNRFGHSWFPQLAVAGGGAFHVVWSDDILGELEIYYARVVPEKTGDSTIAQAVSLPITLSNPTLSFLYQLNGASLADSTWFSIQVDNGITATTLLSTTTNTDDWMHRWFDLTPWASQTVTLTFNVHETANRPYAWAYLDEVTLGSAYPDLWVSKSGPATARPGEQAVYTISYGNRGAAAANGVRITDTLPAELTFVAANPLPITTTPVLVWDGGDLSAKSGSFTIAVTATVAPTVPLASTLTNTVAIEAISPELETFNNTTQAATFIGYRTYLPMVMKAYLE